MLVCLVLVPYRCYYAEQLMTLSSHCKTTNLLTFQAGHVLLGVTQNYLDNFENTLMSHATTKAGKYGKGEI